MSLKEQMAIDVAATFLNLGEFADTATVTLVEVQEESPPATFAAIIVPGDRADSYSGNRLGVDLASNLTALADRAAWRTASATVLGTGNDRDPQRGDQLSLPAGTPYAGLWYVTGLAPDLGGGLQINCVRPEHFALAGENTVEIL